jgi:hypothetical protein
MPVVEDDWIGAPLKTIKALFEQNGRKDPSCEVGKYFSDQITRHGSENVEKVVYDLQLLLSL